MQSALRFIVFFVLLLAGLGLVDAQAPTLVVKKQLQASHSLKTGARFRVSCSFEIKNATEPISAKDFNLYWVKNVQEVITGQPGVRSVERRRDMTTVLTINHVDVLDSGSYACHAVNLYDKYLNASSETMLRVAQPPPQPKESEKKAVFGLDSPGFVDHDDLFGIDELPAINPSLLGSDDGVCEPYRGKVCEGILGANYTIYSTPEARQEQIEERLKALMPILTGNALSETCKLFAMPSLCLFAFPICNRETNMPIQVCRSDCKSIQDNICKNEYFSTKTLLDNKISESLQQSMSNLMMTDCTKLGVSSDSPSECLPILALTNQFIAQKAVQPVVPGFMSPRFQPGAFPGFPAPQAEDKTCFQANGVDYRGSQSFTRTGLKCQRWDDQYPHVHSFSRSSPELAGHNFCRNPDNDAEPWCFTTNPAQRKEFCGVPRCSSPDKTSIFADSKMASLMYTLIPGVGGALLLVCIVLAYCLCRRSAAAGDAQNSQQTAKSMSLNSNNHLAPLTGSTGGSSGLPQHPSRLRMSNASIGHKKHLNSGSARVGSSKSSVASSSLNHNHLLQMNHNALVKSSNINNAMEANPFLKPNYDMHPMQSAFNYANQQQQQNSDYNASVKQFTPSNLRMLQEIGKGRFGPVFVGEVIGSLTPNSVIKAVIKTLNKPASSGAHRGLGGLNQYVDTVVQTTSTPNVHLKSAAASVGEVSAEAHFLEQEFYNEISLFSTLRNKFIANLIGVFTNNSSSKGDQMEDHYDDNFSLITDGSLQSHPQCMVFEHLSNGDLHEYLVQRASCNSAAIYNGMLAGSQSNLSSAASSIGGASSNFINAQQQRNVADFLYIGMQIASGMEYLASQNYVHKDLATRNILMGDNLSIKISIDLIAQYKDAYAKDYYKFQSKPLPVRWMSPESLLFGRYTQESDVWSFGVCLWEIFNYGAQPYSGCTNPEVIEMIRDRQLLAQPDECPQRAYALMLDCWNEIPMQRPTFTDIVNRLRNWENYYTFSSNAGGVVNAGGMMMTGSGLGNNGPSGGFQFGQMPPPPSLPLPLHLQSQQTLPAGPSFQMASSYSTNSQTSKASSILGNGTVSTGMSASPPPPPMPAPPSLMSSVVQHQMGGVGSALVNACYSPSKAAFSSSLQQQHQQSSGASSTTATSANLFMAKFNSIAQTKTSPPASTAASSTSGRIYRDFEATNSLRMSQRNFYSNGQSTFQNNHMNNGGGGGNPMLNGLMDGDQHHFDL